MLLIFRTQNSTLCVLSPKSMSGLSFPCVENGNDNMVFLFLYVDQVVRVIVIQKILIEHAEKLRQVKAVLEEGENFSGIYRKVQLKPLKWDGEGEE
ncbi:hypothetical protein IGI04_024031 [Brassica rapa subsp. trilocularis]|uniref:Uncharacterized protein n=1 Tax=Brassica rapa subsp. trilocularis TaxID=1813537 RepID=A0ABQ7M5J0_BRACM|nr:hypothetical protein IGI04_024031 [Brassica rapa subsp. trilocularis]